MTRLSKKELLEELESISKEHCGGSIPSALDVKKYSDFSPIDYRKVWEVWENVEEEFTGRNGGGEKYSREEHRNEISRTEDSCEIIESIQEISERKLDGKTPTLDEFREYSEFNYKNVEYTYGSWSKTLIEAGFEPHCYRNLSKEEIEEGLIELSEEKGRAPTRAEVDDELPWSSSLYHKRYGSFTDAVRDITEYDPENRNMDYNWEIPDECLLFEIECLKDRLGRVPSKNDMNTHGVYSVMPYRSRFGSYGNAVEKVGFEKNTAGGFISEVEGTVGDYGEGWWKKKEEIRERDDYECRVCSREEEQRAPSVHHIRPRREFVEEERRDEMNNEDNLICLCRFCHGKLEGKWKDCDPEEFARKGREYLGIDEEEVEAGDVEEGGSVFAF